jgi:hypothetical protein
MIELSLSLVFVGILSIMIVLIISNTVSSYRRGITLNRINTVGMDLVDDMRTAVQNSSIGSLQAECVRRFPDNSSTSERGQRDSCQADGGASFVKMTRRANVTLAGETDPISVPVYGAFCTGTYSYIWNSGYFDARTGAVVEEDVHAAELWYRNGNGTREHAENFRILKIADDTRAVCRSRAVQSLNGKLVYVTGEGLTNDNVFNISSENYNPVSEPPVDLILRDSDNDLAIYDLSVANPAESATQENVFYSVSFILGTLEGGINITAKGRSCAVPTDYANEFFDYCAINNFTFAAQANGN